MNQDQDGTAPGRIWGGTTCPQGHDSWISLSLYVDFIRVHFGLYFCLICRVSFKFIFSHILNMNFTRLWLTSCYTNSTSMYFDTYVWQYTVPYVPRVQLLKPGHHFVFLLSSCTLLNFYRMALGFFIGAKLDVIHESGSGWDCTRKNMWWYNLPPGSWFMDLIQLICQFHTCAFWPILLSSISSQL